MPPVTVPPTAAPLRLDLSAAALIHNWRWLAAQCAPAASCGAAVKADGYGLGADAVVRHLTRAGCCDFYVATWAEAAALPADTPIAVLHGVRAEDMATALAMPNARPVLNTPGQVTTWRAAGGGRCDVMIDNGMSRLGLSADDVRDGMLTGLMIDTVMSHLACADEDSPRNAAQRDAFQALLPGITARRASLANSAGICLGAGWHFDHVRPGLALYGGMPRPEAAGHLRPVVQPMAQVLQVRDVAAGATVGYNAQWTARSDTRLAILNAGYADGYRRGFSNSGRAWIGDVALPVAGRVSMDLTAVVVPTGADVAEGDWVALDFDLTQAAAQSGLSPYELLTGLGARWARHWID